MAKVTCGKCGTKYDFPDNTSEINCACGAKVFKPKKEESPKEPTADELRKETEEKRKKEMGIKEEKVPAPPKEEKKTVKKEAEEGAPKEESKKKRIINKLKEKAVFKDEVGPKLEELDKSPEPPKSLEDGLLDKLLAIPGIAEKAAAEICEEYKTVEDIKKAIQDKTFSVGGVGFLKKKLMLKVLK